LSLPTNTATATATNTEIIIPTNTEVIAPTPLLPPTDTPTSTPTDTPTSTATETPTSTPTDTPTPTNTLTATATNTPTCGPAFSGDGKTTTGDPPDIAWAVMIQPDGKILLAQDSELNRKVALKLLPEETEQDASCRERLIREAQAAAALDHPYICKIYDTAEIDGKASNGNFQRVVMSFHFVRMYKDAARMKIYKQTGGKKESEPRVPVQNPRASKAMVFS
jgi:hypothetical protein